MEARVLPGERVLIAEYTGRRVTERNFKGEILWQKQLTTWPLSAQRLPNGNTFIVARESPCRVDRAGKEEVFSCNRQLNDIMTAGKTRDGQIVCLTSQSTCIRIGADGKELKSFRVLQVASYGNEVLPNGHVLVAAVYQNKVLEYDADDWQNCQGGNTAAAVVGDATDQRQYVGLHPTISLESRRVGPPGQTGRGAGNADLYPAGAETVNEECSPSRASSREVSPAERK